MSTMLPTPLTERSQQKVETDWTPSTTGYHSSQEDVSLLTPLQTDQALVSINESLDVLETCSGEGTEEPLMCQIQTKWERVSQEEKTFFVRKATEACKIVCSAIAPEDGETLLKAVCKADSPDIENELQPLLEAYRDAPYKDTNTQILSIYANRYPAKKLKNALIVRTDNRMGIGY